MASRRLVRRVLIVALAALVVTGCGVQAQAPPKEEPTVTVPPVVRLSPLAEQEAHFEVPALQRDSARRNAETLTVRVRNINCEGIATGSGFAVTPRILVTNRHVLAGADTLDVNTWDGRTLPVQVAAVGALGDLGVAEVDGSLPRIARFSDRVDAGDVVAAVGYPLGGPLTISPGTVVDRVAGSLFGIPGSVLRLTSHVEPGNSGGPVLDITGRVVAIVFAKEVATGLALAIPVDTLVELAKAGGFQALPACGSE